MTKLEEAKAEFRQWRSQRRSLAEPIPDNLWGKALSLFPEYKRAKICGELGLSGGQFKRRLEQLQQNSAVKSGFVVATNEHAQIIASTSQDVEISIYGTRTVTISTGVHNFGNIMSEIGSLL